MITGEELSKHKDRVELLSREAKKTHETLQGLCNEILFAQDLNSIEKTPPDIDGISEILLHQVSKKVIEHLNHTQSLLIAYEEYSEMLERSFSPTNLRGREIGGLRWVRRWLEEEKGLMRWWDVGS